MLAHLLMAALYFVTLPLFGFCTGFGLLRLRNQLEVAGFTVVFGTAAYLILLNALGHVLPIADAVSISLVLIAIASIVITSLYVDKKEARHLLRKIYSRWFFAYAGIILFVGFVHARFAGSDPWSWQHFPLAASIVEGNFPVMTPINPSQILAYHYGPALLAAALRLLTGMSLSVGFALQPLIGAAGILLFGGAIAFRLTASKRAAFLAGLLALGGTGIAWTHAIPGLIGAITGLMNGAVNPALFKDATMLFSGSITTSPLIFLGHRSNATGFPLLFGLLFVLQSYLSCADRRTRFALLGVGFVLALALTLTMEIAFVLLIAVTIGFAVFTVCFGGDNRMKLCLSALVFLLAVFVPAALIAHVTGGVLQGIGHNGATFAWQFDGTVHYDTYGHVVAFWDQKFWRDFGFPLLLFPIAIFIGWKRRHAESFRTILCGLAALYLVIPFFIVYINIPGEMRRLFFPATSLLSLLAALTIEEFFLARQSSVLRLFGWFVVATMLVSPIAYLAMRGSFPEFRIQHDPLFAGLPAATDQEMRLFDWVRANTTQHDWFYIRNLSEDFNLYTEIEAQMRDRVVFMSHTGRYTIGPIIFWDYEQQWLDTVFAAEHTCRDDAFKALGVRYLIVENAERAGWFASHCRPASWIVRYDDTASSKGYARVYEFARFGSLQSKSNDAK